MPDLTLLERLPTPAEYRALCESVGWGGLINFDAAPDSLARSLFGVVVTDGDTAIGRYRTGAGPRPDVEAGRHRPGDRAAHPRR